MALHNAKEHGCNHNILLLNPVNSILEPSCSTYEKVTVRYFKKAGENVILVDTTDELIAETITEARVVTEDVNRQLRANYLKIEPITSFMATSTIFDDRGSKYNKNPKRYIR